MRLLQTDFLTVKPPSESLGLGVGACFAFVIQPWLEGMFSL